MKDWDCSTYLLVVLETVLVLVCLFAANDGAPKGLDLLREGELRDVGSVEELLFPYPLGQLALVAAAELVVLKGSLQLLLAQTSALLAEQSLAGLVDGAIEAGHANAKVAVAKVHVHAGHGHHGRVEAGKVEVELGGRAGM